MMELRPTLQNEVFIPKGREIALGDEIFIGEENYSQCLDEMKAMYPMHYSELGVTNSKFPLNPDYSKYLALERSGILILCTARRFSELIGYVQGLIVPNMHYVSCNEATEDIYYLKPEYRKGWIGVRLLKEFERACVRHGANRIRISTKVHLDNSILLKFLDYTFTEKVYTKVI